jgi:hypothetical protein
MMLVTLVLTICSGSVCIDHRPFDPMPGQTCAIQGQQIGSAWMLENGYLARGLTLAKYSCQIGRRDAA